MVQAIARKVHVVTDRRRTLPPAEREKLVTHILKRYVAGANKAQIAREVGWSKEFVNRVIKEERGNDRSR
jgi:transposase-like protein